jgi:predicted GNAT family acetyltransferase
MTIQTSDTALEITGSNGRYSTKIADGPEAHMTYRRLDPTTISIDHTLVPNAYRGQGIAAQLVKRGIEDARKNGDKIVPTCSYVAAQFKRHPEWADLLAS